MRLVKLRRAVAMAKSIGVKVQPSTCLWWGQRAAFQVYNESDKGEKPIHRERAWVFRRRRRI